MYNIVITNFKYTHEIARSISSFLHGVGLGGGPGGGMGQMWMAMYLILPLFR